MATDTEIANQALMRVGAESITSGEWNTPSNERSRVVKNSWPFVRRAVLREHPWNVVTTRDNLVPEDILTKGLEPRFDFGTAYAIPVACLRILEVDTSEQWRVERAPVSLGTGHAYTSSYPALDLLSGEIAVTTATVHGFTAGDRVILSSATESGVANTAHAVGATTSHTFNMPGIDPTGFTNGSAAGTAKKVTMSPSIVTDATGDLGVRYIEDVTDPSDFDPMLTEALVLRMAAEIVERVTDSTRKREMLLAEYDAYMREVKHIEGEEQSPSEFEEDAWITSRY